MVNERNPGYLGQSVITYKLPGKEFFSPPVKYAANCGQQPLSITDNRDEYCA